MPSARRYSSDFQNSSSKSDDRAMGKVARRWMARPGRGNRMQNAHLSVPSGEFEGALIGGAGVDGFAVGDDNALERKVEEGAQSGQRPLLMCGRGPDM